MRGNPGYIVSIDTGGKGVVHHKEQEQKFRDIGKSFIRYLDDDYRPVIVGGKKKTGLIDSKRLKVIGMWD